MSPGRQEQGTSRVAYLGQRDLYDLLLLEEEEMFFVGLYFLPFFFCLLPFFFDSFGCIFNSYNLLIDMQENINRFYREKSTCKNIFTM